MAKKESEENIDIIKFRDGIFSQRTRRFGAVAEIMVKNLYNLDDSDDLAYDKKDKNNGKKVEIKFSTVMKKNEDTINEANIIDQIMKKTTSERAIKSDEIDKYKFDCNMQQIKPEEFDTLYYGLFFYDKIEVFEISSDEVKEMDEYSDKQHRGNKGEGQFHITNSNIKEHRKQHLKDTLSYEELYKLLEQK